MTIQQTLGALMGFPSNPRNVVNKSTGLGQDVMWHDSLALNLPPERPREEMMELVDPVSTPLH